MTMPPYPFGETVVRLRGEAVENPYSQEDTELDWSDPAELEIEGVAVAPGPSLESAEAGRARLDVDFTLYLPYGADIKPVDRVTVRGTDCEIEGIRDDWHNPYTGLDAGSVVEVRRVAG